MAELQVEIWQDHIVAGIYAANPHLDKCVNADQYVLQGKVVHIPQAGAAPKAVRNRTDLPAKVVRRKDTDVTYTLDELTSDPVHIPDADQAELSYDKRASVLTETQNALNELAGDLMLLNWAPPASRIIRTTGEAVPAHMGIGSRLKFTTKDLKRAQKQFNKDGVPTADRYIMLDADMEDQFTDSLTESEHRDFSKAYDEKAGIVGKLYGFTFLSRAYVLSYLGLSAVEKAEEFAAATCAAALCWQKDSVEGAKGTVKMFDDEGNPLYYGDIYSFLLRLGGRIRRADNKGVLAIVQGVPSEAWKTGTEYKEGDFVTSGDLLYICIEDHTASAAFETDAAKWEVVE